MTIYLECRECEMRELFPHWTAVEESPWTEIGGTARFHKGADLYPAYCVNHSNDR